LNDISIMTNIQSTTNPNANTGVIEGRGITEEDRGRRVIVLSQKIQVLQPIGVGTILTLRVNGAQVDFEVIGIMGNSGGGSPFVSGASLVPAGSLGNVEPDFTLNIAQADEDQMNRVLLDLSALIPPVLALDLRFIDGLLSRLIQQFSAIPLLVGLLSLLAAAVIMANTVSLATLERRRQIGILKAIGLKGRRVLLVMLLENTLIGLLGGLIGIGLSALGVAIMTALGMGDTVPIPADARTTAIALVVAAVLIAWVATFASARVAIAERVTNVLRYE
jgi:putative ABC transport system permease protein